MREAAKAEARGAAKAKAGRVDVEVKEAAAMEEAATNVVGTYFFNILSFSSYTFVSLFFLEQSLLGVC